MNTLEDFLNLLKCIPPLHKAVIMKGGRANRIVVLILQKCINLQCICFALLLQISTATAGQYCPWHSSSPVLTPVSVSPVGGRLAASDHSLSSTSGRSQWPRPQTDWPQQTTHHYHPLQVLHSTNSTDNGSTFGNHQAKRCSNNAPIFCAVLHWVQTCCL